MDQNQDVICHIKVVYSFSERVKDEMEMSGTGGRGTNLLNEKLTLIVIIIIIHCWLLSFIHFTQSFLFCLLSFVITIVIVTVIIVVVI